MRNSIIIGAKIATPILAMGVAAIAGPAAEPAIMAGKAAVMKALNIAGTANIMVGSSAALITDISEYIRNR